MNVLFIIVCAVIVIGFLVFIHEGGHYLAARAFGVRVTEFMLGLPGPSIGFTHGRTRFGVTAVPLGGYARVCGMEPGKMSPHLEAVLQSVYTRGTALMEDVATDCGISEEEALTALDELVEWGSITAPTRNDKYNTYRTPKVQPTKREIRKAQRAQAAWKEQHAQISPGTQPTAGENEQKMFHVKHFCADNAETTQNTQDTQEAQTARTPQLTQEQKVETARITQGEPVATTTIYPEIPQAYEEGTPRPLENAHAFYESEYKQQYRSLPFWKRSVILLAGIATNIIFAILAFIVIYTIIGIDITDQATGAVTHYHAGIGRSIYAGFNYVGMTIQAVIGLFNPATAAETVSNSTSIVGIAVMSADFFAAGFQDALFFMAMISVSLGIMNLIPIPPLDGGRFIVEIGQRLSHRQISPKLLSGLSAAGMVLILGLFVIMLNQDVQRFIFGNW